MWDDARQLNAIAVTLGVIAAVFLSWALVGWVTRLPAFAFREVVVTTPLVRASGAHLEAVIRGELRGTFFTMDLDAARASLSRVPFVRVVALRRQWPRRLEIEVSEHEPLARWNETALVDTEGTVFDGTFDGELPHFSGPDEASLRVVTAFRRFAADALIESFVKPSEEGGVDEIHLVYTEFISALTQRAVAKRILPMVIEETSEPPDQPLPLYEFEPSAEGVLDALLPRYVESRVFAALLESAAAESSARRRAMKAATDNADELIKSLTRAANAARQAEITQEISEIVGGANALADAK